METWFKFIRVLGAAHVMSEAFGCSAREAMRVLNGMLNAGVKP